MSTVDNLDLSVLADPAVRRDPYPLFAALRETTPFSAMDGTLVVVAGHADCHRLLRDPALSSDRTRARQVADDTTGLPTSFLFRDPPDHTRLRGLVSKAFTPRVVARLRPRITELTESLVAAADPAGFDVVAGLSHPLPVRVISELLGVPASDHDLFAGWSDRLARGLDAEFGSVAPEVFSDALAARHEFAAYFAELIGARRGQDGTDLLSHLIRVEEDGERLSTPELIVTTTLLLVAGHETTTNLIANGILALLRHPAQLDALRADPALVEGAVEESLRYDPAVQFTSRQVRGSYRIADIDAPDGATIALLIAAANRDPAVFADPDAFDIRRANAAQHLSFAAGAHFCLGAGLARLEAAIALGAFARLRGPELVELDYKPNINLRGPQRLVVRFGR
ncbi:cytochrome P450 [Longispora fulva]|uniref:Cytochrome P450 n=1 Tax=Longispora fulva TaxID=619741 RepID=A0A8J7GGV3_9ACTN|nr:cytochrome P450 [Longispora fulva]MBG6137320.1 cytochrome P450 [Longispora fulva]